MEPIAGKRGARISSAGSGYRRFSNSASIVFNKLLS